MNSCTILLLLSAAGFLLAGGTENPGVQMRMTQKGMQYVIEVGKRIVQAELLKRTLDVHGSTGKVQYSLTGVKVKGIYFSKPTLSPVPNIGIMARFEDISLVADGTVAFVYKSWIKVKDRVKFTISVKRVSMTVIVSISATADGHPQVALHKCAADVGSVNLKFRGGIKGWIYNLFSGLAEKRLKSKLDDMLCDVIKKEMKDKVQSEIRTFPVVKKLDKWAQLDYSLTRPPLFTETYMDAYFKGEFQSATKPIETKLVAPALKIPKDTTRMIYFWVTNYTINTAGEVYQGSNQFDVELKAWDKKIPEAISKKLNTNSVKLVIPNLSKYPDLPMGVRLVSYKASKVVIEEGDVHLFLYANTTFSVKFHNGTIYEVFQIQFDIDTTLEVKVNKENIGGKVTEFNYNTKITKSNIGKIETPLANPFFKIIVETMIIKKANPKLEEGFPLPNLDNVSFDKLDIKLHKGYIQIGADIVYKPKRSWLL